MLRPEISVTVRATGSMPSTRSWIQVTPFGVTDPCGRVAFEAGAVPPATCENIGW
jgi:hypothetical protein